MSAHVALRRLALVSAALAKEERAILGNVGHHDWHNQHVAGLSPEERREYPDSTKPYPRKNRDDLVESLGRVIEERAKVDALLSTLAGAIAAGWFDKTADAIAGEVRYGSR